jgi:hypothetical protein
VLGESRHGGRERGGLETGDGGVPSS